MSDWSPSLYARFEDERTRPARDLVAQVPLDAARRIVDMGCGPGNSTELLVARWPAASVLGLDSSPAMLEEARKRLPQASFAQADANVWRPEPGTDLVFANAIYQWLPNHLEVLPEVLAALDEGACLAVQMPDNLAEPTHRLMREVAAEGPWAERLEGAARLPLPSPHVYYDALQPFARRIELWHSIYNHVLADAAAIVEWVKSTGLRPFLEPLSADERTAFLADYTGRIARAYPPTIDGRVLLRFPRLFIVAVR
ncbi:MAG: trans-aconitate 2-methyltransferase [Devosia sp. 67-54]|uniref:trans-aconitate 2-methyltransferase n=1 Tax=unclassified Devosia TaxID=196773 RepID=UPI000967B771|nr:MULTISPECIES: trans-aconitate 2-methyltransferase [unclassified Devosia]MBN9303884.1 trans-aconitate 2-methyltransferase [Devosia sp.]OJX17736.1 MAG: trans-aconitate 2-methyltransferase [Devosia sp. 67-54]